jgi:hypothetical protein
MLFKVFGCTSSLRCIASRRSPPKEVEKLFHDAISIFPALSGVEVLNKDLQHGS